MSAAMGLGAAGAGAERSGRPAQGGGGGGVTVGWAGPRPPQAPQRRTRLPSHRTRDARTTRRLPSDRTRRGLYPEHSTGDTTPGFERRSISKPNRHNNSGATGGREQARAGPGRTSSGLHVEEPQGLSGIAGRRRDDGLGAEHDAPARLGGCPDVVLADERHGRRDGGSRGLPDRGWRASRRRRRRRFRRGRRRDRLARPAEPARAEERVDPAGQREPLPGRPAPAPPRPAEPTAARRRAASR